MSREIEKEEIRELIKKIDRIRKEIIPGMMYDNRMGISTVISLFKLDEERYLEEIERRIIEGEMKKEDKEEVIRVIEETIKEQVSTIRGMTDEMKRIYGNGEKELKRWLGTLKRLSIIKFKKIIREEKIYKIMKEYKKYKYEEVNRRKSRIGIRRVKSQIKKL